MVSLTSLLAVATLLSSTALAAASDIILDERTSINGPMGKRFGFCPSSGCGSGSYCFLGLGCASCATGTIFDGSNSCGDAPAGGYSDAGKFVQCLEGFFQPNTRATSCNLAPLGAFCSGKGSTSYTWASAGTYCSKQGQSAPTPADPGCYVPSPRATAPTKADLGWWAPGGSSCTSQTKCTKGTYTDTTGCSAPKPAPPGSYVPNDGATSHTLCDLGFWAPGGSSCTSQTKCTKGTYTDTTGCSAPKPAPPGSYVPNDGATSHTPCDPGFYAPGGSSCTSQTPAPAGSYCSGKGNSAPTPADPGHSCSGTGNTGQTQCAAGTYQPKSGQSTCLPCPAMSTCEAGCTTPTITGCSAGSYLVAKSGSTAASCQTCPKGQYCGGGSSPPVNCPVNTYNALTGQDAVGDCTACGSSSTTNGVTGATASSQCIAVVSTCAPGSYLVAKTSSAAAYCNTCPKGSFCPGGTTTTPTPCPVDTYGTLTGQDQSTDCTACSGSSSTNGVTGATMSSQCIAVVSTCNAGSYLVAKSGSTAAYCKTCDKGAYCLGGTNPPTLCSADFFNPDTGSSSKSCCQACPSSSSTNGATGSDSSSDCIPSVTTCNAGFYLVAKSGSTPASCATCPMGQFCTGGTNPPTNCPKDTYNSGTGKTSSSGCTACSSSTSTNGLTGQTSSSACVPTTITTCSAGSFLVAKTSSTPASCSPCAKGQYCPGGTNPPVPCPVNTYNPLTSQSSSSACTACASGSTTNGATGSDDSSDCKVSTCNPGYYASSSLNKCVICPLGAYCTGPTPPAACPTGTYNLQLGQDSVNDCKPCLLGSASSIFGLGSLCNVCDFGFYADVLGLTGCKSCPAGYYTKTNGCTDKSQCVPCTGNTISAAGDKQCTPCTGNNVANTDHTKCVPQATGGWGGYKRSSGCEAGFTSCPVQNGRSGAFECVDTQSDIQSCGGCWGASDPAMAGEDCTAFDDLAEASCVRGKCHYTCPRGFELTAMGCVRASVSKASNSTRNASPHRLVVQQLTL